MIRIVDNFCPQYKQVLESFQKAGFGTCKPDNHMVGSGKYEGVGFLGDHHFMLYALMMNMGSAVIPNSMFARCTSDSMERAYIHSDRASGSFTCVAYLNDPGEGSGTAFYRHRETGLTEMPLDWMADPKRSQEMVDGTSESWEETDFVRGMENRAVIFSAPLFHSRFPLSGTVSNRITWCCHFHIPAGGGQ